jgi:hypothetical protein
MNKSSDSYKVYTEAKADGKQTSGAVDGPNKEVGGQSYPGRALPPTQQVTEAKVEKGVAVACQRKQTGENRYPINSHVEEKKEYGPNN